MIWTVKQAQDIKVDDMILFGHHGETTRYGRVSASHRHQNSGALWRIEIGFNKYVVLRTTPIVIGLPVSSIDT